MSLTKFWYDNKHCFFYCGDNQCDCSRSPFYPQYKKDARNAEALAMMRLSVKLGGMVMSPLEIHCLLEMYALADAKEDGANQHPMAVEALSKGGLIQEVEDEVIPEHFKWILTEKGRVHVENLCRLKWPVATTVWEIPTD